MSTNANTESSSSEIQFPQRIVETPIIKKGKLEFMSIFEMSEGELETLERGSKHSTYLNFSISFLSASASFFTSLVTVDFTNKLVLFVIFLTATIIGGISGIVLLAVWLKSKNETDEVLKKIRKRISE